MRLNGKTFPKVDFHTHIFQDRSYLPELFHNWSLRIVVINITGEGIFDTPMHTRWEWMRTLKEQYPEYVTLCTTFSAETIDEPDFAQQTIALLKEHLKQGAQMVKVWKDIGLSTRDAKGQYVMIDDTRFQPIWDFLADQEIPVLAHIGEPKAAWEPLDPKSPHYRFYRDHPEQHLYYKPDAPSWESLIEARDRWLERNPHLTVIGAHLGSMAHDVDLVRERLAKYPNFYVDTAERFGDLVIQSSSKVRAFFCDFADRILYGTDIIIDKPAATTFPKQQSLEFQHYTELLQTHWEYLAGEGKVTIADKLLEPVTVEALHLPVDVLHQIYHKNAERLLS